MKRFDIFGGNTVALADGPYCLYAEVEARDKRITELEGLARGAEVNRKAWKESAISKDALIAELERRIAQLEEENSARERGANMMQTVLGERIAELEKQAAIDKTLLALADARINRELRDDLAGRAMQGLISAGHLGPHVAKDAYVYSDEMLKAKGGA